MLYLRLYRFTERVAQYQRANQQGRERSQQKTNGELLFQSHADHLLIVQSETKVSEARVAYLSLSFRSSMSRLYGK